jgi:uncharacterized membrane protein YeaQ/YmgE (transglycosylase-associated protein family)
MDTLLWIAVGLGIGWAGSKLMLSSGDRLTSGVVAGFVGAVLGASAMRLLGPATQAGRVDTLAAALAGALWLTWAVCVVTFARRSDDELGARAASRGPVDRRRSMVGGSVPGAAPLP